MNKENSITIKNLIYALLFLFLGIILLTSTEDLIGIISKTIGGILVAIGIIKSIIYIYMKGKLGDYSIQKLIVALLFMCAGILLILSSSALSFAIRTIIGLWTLFAGINRIILAISVKSFDKTGFRMYLSTSLIMIVIGVLLISGLFDQIIGIFIIIYAVTEIVDYIYYKVKDKDYKPVEKEKKSKVNSKVKKIKNKKVMDAIVEDTDKK